MTGLEPRYRLPSITNFEIRKQLRFGVKRHGGIGFPNRPKCPAAETAALNGHPFFGETAAFGTKFASRHIILVQTFIAVLLFDFHSSAGRGNPSRAHRRRLCPSFVASAQSRLSGFCSAHGRYAHRHWRRAGRHAARIFRGPPLRAQFVIKANARPICENFGLAFGETGLHWKVRLRQIKRFAIVA